MNPLPLLTKFNIVAGIPPGEAGHRFRAKVDSDSGARWTPVPGKAGHSGLRLREPERARDAG